MKTVILAIVAALVSLASASALAQEAAMSIDEMFASCEALYPDKVAAVGQCVNNLRLAGLEDVDRAILGRLDEGERRDGEILTRLDGLGDKVDGLARDIAARSAPAEQVDPLRSDSTATPVETVAYGSVGVAWTPVAQATVMSIHNITGMEPDTLHLTDMNDSRSRERCGGVGSDYLVVTNHGSPVGNVFAPAGAPPGFVDVYFDENGDGVPDGSVLALDLARQDDFWVTWRTGDDLQFRYLRRGGQIAVAGLPLQTLYRLTTRADADVVGCARDVLSRPGGHQMFSGHNIGPVRH